MIILDEGEAGCITERRKDRKSIDIAWLWCAML